MKSDRQRDIELLTRILAAEAWRYQHRRDSFNAMTVTKSIDSEEVTG